MGCKRDNARGKQLHRPATTCGQTLENPAILPILQSYIWKQSTAAPHTCSGSGRTILVARHNLAQTNQRGGGICAVRSKSTIRTEIPQHWSGTWSTADINFEKKNQSFNQSILVVCQPPKNHRTYTEPALLRLVFARPPTVRTLWLIEHVSFT